MVSRNEHLNRSQCPVALGLDIVGDHWTLLIVRDLLILGKHEYRELLDSDEGISSNILTDRLNKLQEQGLVNWIHHPESKRRKLYYLTGKGKDLIYVLMALIRWTTTHRADEILIPEDLMESMQQSSRQFVESTLMALSQWETSFGITTASPA